MSSSEKGDELEHYVQGKLEVGHGEPEHPDRMAANTPLEAVNTRREAAD